MTSEIIEVFELWLKCADLKKYDTIQGLYDAILLEVADRKKLLKPEKEAFISIDPEMKEEKGNQDCDEHFLYGKEGDVPVKADLEKKREENVDIVRKLNAFFSSKSSCVVVKKLQGLGIGYQQFMEMASQYGSIQENITTEQICWQICNKILKERGQQQESFENFISDAKSEDKGIENIILNVPQKGKRVAPGINPNLNYGEESSTRVGFEIELAVEYQFSAKNLKLIEHLTNQTLATYYNKENIPILEMLIDDVKINNKNKKNLFTEAQVEFRTVPLEFDQICLELSEDIRKAISGFNVTILKSGGEQKVIGGGYWKTLKVLPEFPSKRSTKLQAPKNLAQHATLSIEPEAFSKLEPEQREVLVPYLKYCKSRQDIYDKLVDFVCVSCKKVNENAAINASTTGRNAGGKGLSFALHHGSKQSLDEESLNTGGIDFKTPLEAILVADTTLKTDYMDGKKGFPSSVYFDDSCIYPIGDLVSVKSDMTEFPKIQGENKVGSGIIGEKKNEQIGYRVVAEKLQPLLLDKKSGIPRILFEHRGGRFVDAINAALNVPRSKIMESKKMFMYDHEEKVLKIEEFQLNEKLKGIDQIYLQIKQDAIQKLYMESETKLKLRLQTLEGIYKKKEMVLAQENPQKDSSELQVIMQDLMTAFEIEKDKLEKDVKSELDLLVSEEDRKLVMSREHEKAKIKSNLLELKRTVLFKRMKQMLTLLFEREKELKGEISLLKNSETEKQKGINQAGKSLKDLDKEVLSPEEQEKLAEISELKKDLIEITKSISEKMKQLNEAVKLRSDLEKLSQSDNSENEILKLEQQFDLCVAGYFSDTKGLVKYFFNVMNTAQEMDIKRISLPPQEIMPEGKQEQKKEADSGVIVVEAYKQIEKKEESFVDQNKKKK